MDPLFRTLVGLAVGLSCVGTLGLIVFALVWRRRQRDSCAAWAARRGMRFEADVPTTAAGEPDPRLAEVGPFPLFRPRTGASHPHMWNVAHGVVDGVEVWLFEYSDDYDTDSEKINVVCFRAAGLDLPAFTLEPRLRLLGLSLGAPRDGHAGPDLALGTAAFDENYALRGPDEVRIRNAFAPGVIEFFSQRTGWSGWSVQGEGDRLLMTRLRVRWDALADEGRRGLDSFRGAARAS